ncbi:MATE family efflux transporter [Vibrio nigripulchritudo]|uniref:MATE family efflux transporter n=1 Tax=Vibrio nigripulchritudo TaxID=28173 RepID=UPI00056F5890|nr:MATE family efflux transporter [Vibrio nigripulchritudo]
MKISCNFRLFATKKFFSRLISLAIPISLYSMLLSSRNIIDVVMLSQIGSTEVASMGVALRGIMIGNLFLFSICSCGAIFTAQYSGASNKSGVRQATALTAIFCLPLSFIVALNYYFFSKEIMGFASSNHEVIKIGSDYLKITCISMLAISISGIFSAGLRSIGQASIATGFNALGIILNIILNYILIFGNLGFPALGVEGAAWGTVLSAIIECISVIIFIYGRGHILSFNIRDILEAKKEKIKTFYKICIPLSINSLMWPSSLFIYHSIIGNISTDALAAMAMITPVETYSMAIMMGVATAASIMQGNILGKKKFQQAYYQAWIFVIINILLAIVVSLILFFIKPWILSISPNLNEEMLSYLDDFYNILLIGILIKSAGIAMVIGVLRASGDTKFCMNQDIICQWIFGIPLTIIAAYWLEWSAVYIYACMLLEEVAKLLFSIKRLRSKSWLKSIIN